MLQPTTGSKFSTRAKKEGMSKTLQPVSVSIKAIIAYLYDITITDWKILAYRILLCLQVFYAQRILTAWAVWCWLMFGKGLVRTSAQECSLEFGETIWLIEYSLSLSQPLHRKITEHNKGADPTARRQYITAMLTGVRHRYRQAVLGVSRET